VHPGSGCGEIETGQSSINGNQVSGITPKVQGGGTERSWIVANPEGAGVDRPSSAGASDSDTALQSGLHLLQRVR
jgi:hypothetical protein